MHNNLTLLYTVSPIIKPPFIITLKFTLKSIDKRKHSRIIKG
nr:MAG TPA: hypothetical protein [Caudoviricetes sp.]